MTVAETGFRGMYLLEPRVHMDARGYFLESYNARVLADVLKEDIRFVQDNQSRSVKGVVRGLHFQLPPKAQTKVIRVLQGEILDIVVDLRKSEPTCGRSYVVTLSEENKKQLWVPKGFAHGFAVLSETAEILYKCDDYYSPADEAGLNIMDVVLGLDRVLPEGPLIMSDKDKNLPGWADLTAKF